MSQIDANAVEQGYLSNVHVKWLDVYRTPENNKFFDKVMSALVTLMAAPRNSTLLDVGCGDCDDAIRLADAGFRVHAVDFSNEALLVAKDNVVRAGYTERITLEQGDVCALSSADNCYKYILCWGVLTTIPDLKKAMNELVRVLAPGGVIIFGEHNMMALQLMLSRSLRFFMKKRNHLIKKTSAGIEVWRKDEEGLKMTRQTNIKWFIHECERRGLRLEKRLPGQFSQAYTHRLGRYAIRLIHGINNLWFDYVKLPYLAVDNILIFHKGAL